MTLPEHNFKLSNSIWRFYDLVMSLSFLSCKCELIQLSKCPFTASKIHSAILVLVLDLLVYKAAL